jgi:hypothetical protein
MKDEPRRILILVGGSEQSLDGARYAAETIRPVRGAMTLLHIFNKVPDAFWELERDPAWTRKVQRVRGWVSPTPAHPKSTSRAL